MEQLAYTNDHSYHMSHGHLVSLLIIGYVCLYETSVCDVCVCVFCSPGP